jgi:hypothetical protein
MGILIMHNQLPKQGAHVKLTNKFNLPQTFVNVLKRPTYSKGRANISATGLINSPKIVALTAKHHDELEEDVADMVWSLFGSAVHAVLEHGKDDTHLIEERVHIEIDGWHISGAIDLQIKNDNSTVSIRDYKTTSAWAVMNEKIEWEQQLNIYGYLIEKVKGTPIKDLGIVAIIRDWSRRDAASREGYPEAPIKELPIKLWSMEEREQFILDRISKHSACEFAMETGEPLPDCTPEEMWEKPAVFAVRKTGGVRAKSLHESEEEAKQAAEKLGKGYEVEVRPGERSRCANFCSVNTYCQQWQEYQSRNNHVSE